MLCLAVYVGLQIGHGRGQEEAVQAGAAYRTMAFGTEWVVYHSHRPDRWITTVPVADSIWAEKHMVMIDGVVIGEVRTVVAGRWSAWSAKGSLTFSDPGYRSKEAAIEAVVEFWDR